MITKKILLTYLHSSWKDIPQLSEWDCEKLLNSLNANEFEPPLNKVFNAFKYTPFDKLKVVILGQDPYKIDSNGLAFSVSKHCKRQPPSLRNMMREIFNGIDSLNIVPKIRSLKPWAREGVLLLNTVLTIEKSGVSNSHKNIGWEEFVKIIIKHIVTNKPNTLFMLFGMQAQTFIIDIENDENIHINKLCVGHPSPLNRSGTFIGSDCFNKANDILLSNNMLPIRWHAVWRD